MLYLIVTKEIIILFIPDEYLHQHRNKPRFLIMI